MKVIENKIIMENGSEINDPVVIIDKAGVFHKFGNYEDMVEVYKNIKEKDLLFMIFDTDRISHLEIVEIVDNMINVEGYCKTFYEKSIENAENDSSLLDISKSK